MNVVLISSSYDDLVTIISDFRKLCIIVLDGGHYIVKRNDAV